MKTLDIPAELTGMERAQFIADEKYGGIVGTDMCTCLPEPDALYPACPHDLRGHPGVEGPSGT